MSGDPDLTALAARLTELLADDAEAPELDAERAERMKARVLRRAATDQVGGTLTIHADEGTWEPFADGITRKLLSSDAEAGMELALYRLEPGRGFPPHAHTHVEECWVVEGDILVGDLLVEAGAMHIAHAGTEHPALTARSSAVLLIRSQVYVGPLTPPG